MRTHYMWQCLKTFCLVDICKHICKGMYSGSIIPFFPLHTTEYFFSLDKYTSPTRVILISQDEIDFFLTQNIILLFSKVMVPTTNLICPLTLTFPRISITFPQIYYWLEILICLQRIAIYLFTRRCPHKRITSLYCL